jgi:Ca2+-binding RTX toxin-like protein
MSLVDSTRLNFSATGLNMWGAGQANLDTRWTGLLWNYDDADTFHQSGSLGELSFDYGLHAQIGFMADLAAQTGSVDISYPIEVDVRLPTIVRSGEAFVVDTSNWRAANPLLQTFGFDAASASFGLDFVFRVAGGLSNIKFDAPLLPPLRLGDALVEIDESTTLIDIGVGDLSGTFDAPGQMHDLTVRLPESLETRSHPAGTYFASLQPLSASGTSEPFMKLDLDVDALAQSVFDLPEGALYGTYAVRGVGDLNYSLLGVTADLGLELTQEFSFVPQSVGVTLTANTGETHSGVLGQAFTFTSPASASGTLDIEATYTLNGVLVNKTGFVLSDSIKVDALSLDLQSKLGPGFSWNLFNGPVNDSNLLGRPAYFFDTSIPVSGMGIYSDTYHVAYSASAITDTADPSASMSITQGSVTTQAAALPFTGVPINGVRLDYQFLGTTSGEVLVATAGNDFVNLDAGDDAAAGGAGADVLDGGTGSNFLSGGAGTDTFFLDGRSGSITWSTITDWMPGEQLSIWGWKADSKIVSWREDGAVGYQGLTMHADLDNDGTIDTSVTWTGQAQSAIPAPEAFADQSLLWFV